MATNTQNPIVDAQNTMTKQSKHRTTENHQVTKEDIRRKKQRKRTTVRKQ